MPRTSKVKEKQEPIREVVIPMKDVTDRFSKMIVAFKNDFVLARDLGKGLIEIQTALQSKNEKLLQDIELLEYLSFGVSHGTIRIYEKEGGE